MNEPAAPSWHSRLKWCLHCLRVAAMQRRGLLMTLVAALVAGYLAHTGYAWSIYRAILGLVAAVRKGIGDVPLMLAAGCLLAGLAWLYRKRRVRSGVADFFRFSFRGLPHTISFQPLLVSFLCFALLAWVGQMHEIYLTMIEHREWARFLLGYACISLLSVRLYFWYLARTRERLPLVHGMVSGVAPNPTLSSFRNFMALVCGFLPFAGLTIGVWEVQDVLLKTASSFDLATQGVKDRPLLAIPFTAKDKDHTVPIQLITGYGYHYLTVCILGAMTFLGFAVWRWNRQADQPTFARLQYIVIATTSTLALLTWLVLPVLPPAMVLWVSQGLGPLAMAALQVLLILWFLTILAHYSRQWGVPLVLGLVLFVAFNAYRAQTTTTPPRNDPAGKQTAAAGQPDLQRDSASKDLERDLHEGFKNWLAHRRDDNTGQFPVFIIAAQGGGIYAASAIANFLAKLQDSNPCFLRHVFVISGVSGGSVGSALFDAAARARNAVTDKDCGKQAVGPKRQDEQIAPLVRSVVSQDHLSPVLALLVPEYAEKAFWLSSRRIVSFFWSPPKDWPGFLNRASALELSLACSFQSQVKVLQETTWRPTYCERSKPQFGLDRKFIEAATDQHKWPALVLNTTFAETGKRVAFSPYRLNGVGEKSLDAFVDRAFKPELTHNMTLIEAAVASARFPGLLPALALPFSNSRDFGKFRWNFVDGGYADNSGAATAAAIYDSLEKYSAEHKLNIDLRLVILTDEEKQYDLEGLQGTALVDTRAPLEALLNVRSHMSTREVNRAEARFAPSTPAQDWRVKILRLDQSNFSLRLGWTLSNTTNFVVSMLTSRPEFCVDHPTPSPADAGTDTAAPITETEQLARKEAQLIYLNACNLGHVIKVLKKP